MNVEKLVNFRTRKYFYLKFQFEFFNYTVQSEGILSVVVVVPASTCMRGLFTLYMLFILTCAKEGERKGKKKEKKEKEDPISYLIFQLTTDDRLGENRKMSKKNITV